MVQHVCSLCCGSDQCIILLYNEQTFLSFNKGVETGTIVMAGFLCPDV